MDDDVFWGLIDRLDWAHKGDDQRIIEPVVGALATRTEDEIRAFQEALAQKLFLLDGRAWARESGPLTWWGDPDSVSSDDFLYSRCVVVANGREYFDSVLRDPTRMPKDLEFEVLITLAMRALERKTGRTLEYNLDTKTSFETFANKAAWPQ